MATQSDLLPENVTLNSSTFAPGASIGVSWLLANTGSGAANSTSTTELRITQSPTSFAGTDLTGVTTAALSGNTSVAQSATLTAPTTPGTYYVWAIADNFSNVTNQSSTSDDEAHSIAFTVAAPQISDNILDNVNTSGVLSTTVSSTIDATPMPGSTTNVSNGNGGSVDKDWFKVTLNKGQIYTFSGTDMVIIAPKRFGPRFQVRASQSAPPGIWLITPARPPIVSAKPVSLSDQPF